MRIAVLTAGLTESYQITIRNGILEEAEKQNIEAWFLPGMPTGFGPSDGEGCRSLFPMIHQGNFDGIIATTSSYSSFMEINELREYCLQFSPIPVVSVGIKLEGIPSVVVDPEPGLRALLDHLSQEHSCKNFLFVGGPQKNKESDLRMKIFLEYLSEHKLPSEPERIRHGDFMADSIPPLLKDIAQSQFKLPLDAIIFANDKMAISSIKLLLEAGLTVPEDIIVVGFDNILESDFSFPPLTTVQQPLLEMGAASLKMIKTIIEKKKYENIIFPTTLVIRESCGCPPLFLKEQFENGSNYRISETEADLKQIILEKLEEKNITVDKKSEKNIIRLIDCLFNDPKNFLSLFSRLIKKDVLTKTDVRLWRETIALLQIFSPKPDKTVALLDNARTLINQYIYLADQLEKEINQEKNRMVTDFGTHLLARSKKDEILSLLENSLAPLYKGFFLIALFVDDQYSQLFYFHDSSGTPVTKYNDLIFKTSAVFPPPLKNNNIPGFIVSALNFNEEKLGYIMMEETPDIIDVYYTFTWQLSNALKMNSLTKEQENNTITLRQKVEERTKELVQTNTSLKEEIENRKTAEKRALTSERKFKTILETIPFPLAICRISDGVILYHNTPFYTFIEMAGEDYFPVENIFLFQRDFQKMMDHLKNPDDIQSTESVLLTRKKLERHCLLSTELITYEEEPSFILGIHDLTEKRALEKEILNVSDRERRRIGQDLHDDLGQKLAGIAVLSRVLQSKLEKQKSDFSTEAKEISEYMEESIIQTKKLARGLYPVVLKHQGLPAALKELTELIESQFGIDCQLIFDDKKSEYPFSQETFIQLYRITQEAVSNAARHSGGDEITIHLTDKKDAVLISISDNGRGMELKNEFSMGLGMTTMEYRAGLIGAELEIKSKPGKGTNVNCRVLKV